MLVASGLAIFAGIVTGKMYAEALNQEERAIEIMEERVGVEHDSLQKATKSVFQSSRERKVSNLVPFLRNSSRLPRHRGVPRTP